MILDGVSYSAFIQYCRVILSRYGRTLVLPVFSRASTEYFCLWASIGAPVLIQDVLYHRLQDSKTFPLARVYQRLLPLLQYYSSVIVFILLFIFILITLSSSGSAAV